jgi:hypothetical protein
LRRKVSAVNNKQRFDAKDVAGAGSARAMKSAA